MEPRICRGPAALLTNCLGTGCSVQPSPKEDGGPVALAGIRQVWPYQSTYGLSLRKHILYGGGVELTLLGVTTLVFYHD